MNNSHLVLLECERYSVIFFPFFLRGGGAVSIIHLCFFVDSMFACLGQSAIRFGASGSFYCFVSVVSVF